MLGLARFLRTNSQGSKVTTISPFTVAVVVVVVVKFTLLCRLCLPSDNQSINVQHCMRLFGVDHSQKYSRRGENAKGNQNYQIAASIVCVYLLPDWFYDLAPPPKPAIFFNERFIATTRHDEERRYEKISSRVFLIAKAYRTMTSGWQGAPHFRRYSREMVS